MTNSTPLGSDYPTILAAHWSGVLMVVFLGLAGGFQSIYVKFGSDALRVLTTFSGLVYWLSRGLIPAVVYIIWLGSQQIGRDSIWYAVGCGLASEAVLRSRFYLRDRKAADGKVEEVAKGVFDLLNWYQVLLLKFSGDRLAVGRKKFIETLMAGETDFLQLCRRARSNTGAWAIEDEKQHLLNLIDQLEKRFTATVKNQPENALREIHKNFIFEIGYAAMRFVGRGSLKTFFK